MALTPSPMRTPAKWCCTESTRDIDVNDIGSQRITLDETKDYRFMLEVIGNTIHGQVTEIETGDIVAKSFADISRNEPIYASGTSGAYGYTFSPFSTLFGIDNFRAEEALAGDYNRDGSVDAADYVVWRDTVGNTSPQLDPSTFRVTSFGDMRANGAISGMCGFNTPDCEVIDEADYEVWRANFGRTVSSGSAAGGGTCRTRANQCRAGSDGIAVRECSRRSQAR